MHVQSCCFAHKTNWLLTLILSSRLLKLPIKGNVTFHFILTHANSRPRKRKRGGGGGQGGNKTSLGDVTQVVTMTTLFEGHRNLTALHASLGFLTTNPKHA